MKKSTCCDANVYQRYNDWLCCECEKFCCPVDDVIHAPRPLAYEMNGKFYLETAHGRKEFSRWEYNDLKEMFKRT